MENGIDIYQPILGLPLLEWFSLYGYIILIPLMFLEGRVVSMIAAAFAQLGLLNIYLVWGLLITVSIMSDVFYYHVGRSGSGIMEKLPFTRRIATRFRNSRPGNTTVSYFHEHGAKIFFLTKAVPSVSWPLQIVAGASRMPPKSYFLACLASNLVWGTLFVSIGYFMAYLAQRINIYLFIILAIGVLFSLFFLGKYLNKRFLNGRVA